MLFLLFMYSREMKNNSECSLLKHVQNMLKNTGIFYFCGTGKGLTLVTSVLEGKWTERYADAQAAKQVIISLFVLCCCWRHAKV